MAQKSLFLALGLAAGVIGAAGLAGAQDDSAAPPEAQDAAPLEPAEPAQAVQSDAVVAAAARLREAIERIDPSATFTANGATFQVSTVPVTLVYDINADRMRLVSPIKRVEEIEPEIYVRLMQANFDSALDARYAVARGVLWSTFIHPLSTLTSDEFGSGLGQTVNLVASFGTTYSSGAFVFGGGDSAEEQQRLIEELQNKTREI